MTPVVVPPGLEAALNDAWRASKMVPGFLLENEARFLGMMAACAPREGVIVEIGSFKGKSTVMLAKLAERYGLGPIVAIDPHNFNNAELEAHRSTPGSSSYDEFRSNLEAAGVSPYIEVHREFSTVVARGWKRPIRLLWIDGDHTYEGAKADFDGFMPHVVPGGFVALHDALHEFSGPIRVFVEDMLRSNRFGAAGFVNSIAWSQYRPEDSFSFRGLQAELEPAASRILPFVSDGKPLRGVRKIRFKLARSRVPRALPSITEWTRMLNP